MRFMSMAALCLAAALGAGCATQVEKSPAAGAAPRPAGMPAVNVPVASGKRLVLRMTGPQAVTTAKDWPAFKEEWRATFAEHAKDAGVAFSVQDGDAAPGAGQGTLLNVYVNDYRLVGIGARIMLGVFTGNAYIDAKLEFRNLATGGDFGSQQYNTSSSAGQGIFGKMTPQQVDAIAAEVFAELKGGR